jgi:uncharacterized protein (DUF427 family)
MKAVWRGKVIADSDKTILIEGNHYFPPDSIDRKYLKESKFHSLCYWKGLANYYHIDEGGSIEKNAAWYYPKATWLSRKIMRKDFSNYVAYWGDVKIKE